MKDSTKTRNEVALDKRLSEAITFCSLKFDCGCGGGEVLICHKLAENSFLLLLAAWLVFNRHCSLCARFSLLERDQM